MPRKRLDELDQIAREKMGYNRLRPGQKEVIQHILNGEDVLSVMPTGSGKSAIYQIAGLLLDGPTIVVAPLIALQKDQVDSINEKDLPDAAVVNSAVKTSVLRKTFEKFEGGQIEYLFLTPEQFANEETMNELLENKPSLFVVDEAHCISEWGHDFRPEYARMGKAIEALGHPTVLALTATAAPKVREDITEKLGMKKPRIIVWGFDRPNIWMGVEKCPDSETKSRILIDRVKDLEKPGIIYVATHNNAEQVAKWIADAGFKCAFYHGGMKKPDRDAVQDQFMTSKIDIVVATSAFGMGVDKSDVRFVIHYDIPESVDEYYQEVGRAGRDGKPANAILLYREEDVGLRRAMAAQGKITEHQVEQVARELEGQRDAVEVEAIAEATEMKPGKVKQVIHRLEDVGAVDIEVGGEVVPEKKLDREKVAEDAVEEHEMHREYQQGRVEMMKDFAESRDCRRRYVLRYFGEETQDRCNFCDNCDAGFVEQAEACDENLPFPLKCRVKHKSLGEGTVMRYEDDKIVVLFEEAGYKSLVTEYVLEKKLMERL